jgi:hypothetical protein
MKIFLPTLAGLLLTAVIAVVVIGLNGTHEAAVGLNAQARVRGLAVQLQRQASRINRAADDMAEQDKVTTNQALAFTTAAGQVVIPAGTTLRIVRRSGTDVVVEYNGIEVNLPGSAIDFR